jgi:hypothetical protein
MISAVAERLDCVRFTAALRWEGGSRPEMFQRGWQVSVLSAGRDARLYGRQDARRHGKTAGCKFQFDARHQATDSSGGYGVEENLKLCLVNEVENFCSLS